MPAATVFFQLRTEQTFALLQEILADAGTVVVVLKGPHVGNIIYADPTERPYCDLDVLVRPAQFDDAIERLVARGFVRAAPLPERAYSHGLQYSDHLLSPEGIVVDFHRNFAAYDRYPVDLNAMFERAEPFMLGRVPAKGLGATDLLFGLCLHIVHSYFQVAEKHIRDLALVTARLPVDWPLFLRLVSEARCARGTYYCLAAARELHGAAVPESVIGALRPGLVWRAYLERFVAVDRFPMLRRRMSRSAVQRALALVLMDRVRDWPGVAARYAALRVVDWWGQAS